jgi:hypothetical protein
MYTTATNDVFVPDDMLTTRYWNHKDHLSQNILAACAFDMQFYYVLASWKGSTADSHIYEICDSLLVPYRGFCYHLDE